MRNISTSFLITATINTFITSFSLFAYSNQSFSLYKLLNLFILLFFVLANAFQYSKGVVVTSLFIDFKPEDYESFQFLTLAILFLYNIIYLYTTRYKIHSFKKTKTTKTLTHSPKNKLSRDRILLFLSIFALIAVFLRVGGNPNRLFFRGIQEGEAGGFVSIGSGSQMEALIFDKIIRPIPFCCYLLSIFLHTNKKVRVYLFFSMLLAVFPTGLSRNAAAMYWLPVILTRFTYFQRKNVFVFLMALGILVIFPFLDNFRHYNGEIETEFSLDYLYTMHFDSSQEFMTAIKMHLITNGRQLLGVLFFFVPRSIWPTKPIGSGAYMASQQFDVFSNISMPYFGEGYVNFGYYGVFVFTIFIAWFTANLDCNYWYKYRRKKNEYTLLIGIYLIVLASIIFILRGDLMSSFAYTVGTCLSYLFVFLIATKKIEISLNKIGSSK